MTRRIAETADGRVWVEWDDDPEEGGYMVRQKYTHLNGRISLYFLGYASQVEGDVWETEMPNQTIPDLTEPEAVHQLWTLATEGMP